MDVYRHKDFLKPTMIQKLFGITPTENAMIEINNLFAIYQADIKNVSIDQIIDIGNKYKVDLKTDFKAIRLDLFKSYLLHCLIDHKLDDNQIESLKHIQKILMLTENDVGPLIKFETEKLYEQHVFNATKDGILVDSEKEKLKQIKSNLLISDDYAIKVQEKISNDISQKFIEDVIADERLSPDEESELNKIARSLGIDLIADKKNKDILEKYKLYWQIENAELPEIESDINIRKSEKLHFKTDVKWHEQRRVTKRINFGGPVARVRIVKGLYYRLGSINLNRISEDVWQIIDSGQIYLTNKRLIFMGSKGNKIIALNNILDVEPYTNGVDIQKETG